MTLYGGLIVNSTDSNYQNTTVKQEHIYLHKY
jgi:hypothetical protein